LPFSIERIDDARVLDWLTAAAVLGAEADYYPPPAVALARARYDREVRGAVAG
jgi:hypothetical protein